MQRTAKKSQRYLRVQRNREKTMKEIENETPALPPPTLTAPEIVEKMVKYLSRAFYDDDQVVLLDCLLEKDYNTENELVERLSIPKTVVNTKLLSLKSEMLVDCEVSQVKKEPHHRYQRQDYVWFIDYKNLIDVVRYRIFRLQQLSKESMDTDITYICTNQSCQEVYECYQLAALAGPNGLVCQRCGEGSIKEKDAIDQSASSTSTGASVDLDLTKRIKNQLQPLLEMNDYCKHLVIPEKERRYLHQILKKDEAKKIQIEKTQRLKIHETLGEHNIKSVRNPQQFVSHFPPVHSSLDAKQDLTVEQNIAENPSSEVTPSSMATSNSNAPKESTKQQMITKSEKDSTEPIVYTDFNEIENQKSKELFWLKKNTNADYMSLGDNMVSKSLSDPFSQKSRTGKSSQYLYSPQTPQSASHHLSKEREEQALKLVLESQQSTPPAMEMPSQTDESQEMEDGEDEDFVSSEEENIQSSQDINLTVQGVPKPFSEITEEDEANMTTEEYNVYYQVLRGM